MGESERLGKRQWAILYIFTVSSFIVVLNAASLPIPLPAILEDLGGTLDEVTWVIGAFALTFAAFLHPAAKLADTYGRRLLLICGLTVFTLTSLAAALSPSMPFLIGATAAQGIGAAMVEPAVFALIKSLFPQNRQRFAFRVQSAGFLAGAALGPILSGSITTLLSWEYVFALNAAVGAAALAGTVLLVPESHPSGTSQQLDLTGLVLGAGGIFFLLFAIIEGTRFGWGTPLIVGSFIVSAVLLVLFVLTELRADDPMVDLPLFKDRLFAVGNFARAVTEFVSLGIFFALSHFLQVQLGYSALVAGLILMSVIAGALLTSPLAETYTSRVDVRWLVIPGFLLAGAGTFWVAHVSPDTNWTFFLVPLAVAGAGIGLLEAPTDSVARRHVPNNQSDMAWRVAYTTYLLGIGLGVAVVSGVWQSQVKSQVTDALARAGPPPAIMDRIDDAISEGGVSGDPAAAIGNAGMAHVEGIVQAAFADAVNVALISCVAAALLGTATALFLSSRRKEEVVTEEPEASRQSNKPAS